MERTKGEVKVAAYTGGWTGVKTLDDELLFKLHLNNENNAEHLVNCWNAFEKGGLVGELVKVVEGLMKEADDGSARFDDPAPDSIFVKAKAVLKKAGVK